MAVQTKTLSELDLTKAGLLAALHEADDEDERDIARMIVADFLDENGEAVKAANLRLGVFSFDLLDEKGKEKAREWFRDGYPFDEWWDAVYEDAATIADILGIDLRERPVKLHGGGTRYDPCIYFSGFCSQGDGACYEGTYRYAKGSVKKIKEHAPQDKELHRIAQELYEWQRIARWSIVCQIKHRGHYNHSGCMDIDVSCDGNNNFNDASDVIQLLRDFADWIYKQLEHEHDYLTSDESVDENITCNEYEFHENGRRA